jgi:predicted nucleic-acid-binding Zn-ribbon protein
MVYAVGWPLVGEGGQGAQGVRMSEPWKVIVCGNEQCMAEALDDKGKVKPDYKIYPEYDTPEYTQFTCKRCGHVETWGVTRRNVAKVLYERLTNAGMGSNLA